MVDCLTANPPYNDPPYSVGEATEAEKIANIQYRHDKTRPA